MSILALFKNKTPEEIGNLLISDVDQFVREKIKETLDELLEGEIEALFDEAFRAKNGDFRNGYYYRHLKSKYGVIEVKVPRDRLNLFKTQLLKPYKQVTDDVDYVIQSLYLQGLSQNELVDYIDNNMHMSLSRETIANMVHKLIHTAEVFRTRSLPRCCVIYLDGTYVPIKRKYGYQHAYVEKECVEIAIGITEDGHRQVLGFYTVPNEGAQNWEFALQDLKRRGIGDPKLFITDGLRGLPEAISTIYPNSLHQSCVVHIQRNISKNVRIKDRKEICADFKDVYEQDNHHNSLVKFQAFINKRSNSYPRLCNQLLINDDIFTFYYFPKAMHKYIRTSNAIESFNATLKRKSKNRILFNGEDNASLVIVQEAARYNNDWMRRIVPFVRDLKEEEKQALGLFIFED